MIKWILAEVTNCIGAGFYGTLSITFQAGKPVLMKKEETFRPPVDLDGKS